MRDVGGEQVGVDVGDTVGSRGEDGHWCVCG